MGDKLDTDEISRRLGLSPTHVHRVGDADARGNLFEHAMWSLQSPLNEAQPPDTHFKWFKQQLNPHYEFLRSLKCDAQLHIYCGYNCDNEQDGFTLSPEALAIFTELEIPMELHILC
jgi:hypothetical protein